MKALVPYHPKNWSDPRKQKRVKIVLDWCLTRFAHIDKKLFIGIPASELDQVFGPKGNRFGDYLRAKLLVRSGNYVVGEKTFVYQLKTDGWEEIRKQAQYSFNDNTSFENARIAKLKQKYASQLESLTFEYTDKSDRLWNGLQNIRRADKPSFWADTLPFDYDIEACAPTLLLQSAKQNGLNHLVGEPINDYLNRKQHYRQLVQDITGLSYHESKQLLNSLFNGARLVPTSYCDAYNTLKDKFSAGQAKSIIDKLNADKELKMLRTSIRLLWARMTFKEGESFRKAKSKWSYYFHQERRVLDVITDHLRRHQNPHFTEHDGFRTKHGVDLPKLQDEIKARTGFDIKISKN
jgi:hypothetical protein